MLAILLCANSAMARDIDERLWILMESGNFSVYSSVSERKTRDLLLHLETLRAVFVTYFGYGRNLDEKPTQILIIGRQSDYRELGLPSNTAGRFMSNLRNNIIVISDARRMDETQVILHEYIHFLVRITDRFPFPLWWSEGYAEFASATRMTDTTFDMGLPLEGRINSLNGTTWLPWEDVISATAYDEFRGYQKAKFYAQSWLLVHYLQTRESATPMEQSWAAYVQNLSEGANQAQAFAQAFDLPMDTLRRDIRRYTRAGRYQYWRIPTDTLGVQLDPMVDGVRRRDMQIQFGQFALANDDGDAALSWFNKAIDGRSKDPAAFAGRAAAAALLGRYDDARTDFERAMELDPTKPATLVEYAIFEIDNAFRDDAPLTKDEYLDAAETMLTQARAITGGSVEIDTYLAFVWLSRDGASIPAMQLLESVVDRSPSDQWPALMLAESLFLNGRSDDALDLAHAVIRYDHGRTDYSESAQHLIGRIQAATDAKDPVPAKKPPPP